MRRTSVDDWPFTPSRVKCMNIDGLEEPGTRRARALSEPASEDGHVRFPNKPSDILPTAEGHEAQSSTETTVPTEQKNNSTIQGIPGDIQVCSEEQWIGVCTSFNAMRRCIALPQDSTWRQVKSVSQAKGAFCGYCE